MTEGLPKPVVFQSRTPGLLSTQRSAAVLGICEAAQEKYVQDLEHDVSIRGVSAQSISSLSERLRTA